MSGTVGGAARQQGAEVGRKAKRAADSRRLERVGQAGVAAIGVVHLLLAWLALQIAFGGSGSGQTADQTGALKQLAGNPVGKVLLILLALGFAAYALWQFAELIVGFHGFGYDRKKRIVKRVEAGAKAVIGALLAEQAVQVLLGSARSASQNQEEWTARLMSAPAGRVLVVAVGLGVVAVSVVIGYHGWTRQFLEKLTENPSRGVELLGAVGFIARGVAYGMVGVLLVVAGITHQPEHARGLDAALKTLADQPFGTVLLMAAALGLAAFGVFDVVTAKYHREG